MRFTMPHDPEHHLKDVGFMFPGFRGWIAREQSCRSGADSGDCGQGFRLNATMRSDRRRPPVPTKAAGGVAGMGVGSDFLGGVKTGAPRSDLSHAVSVECEAVSVVDEPVEDGVCDGRIGDDVVPIFDRHLAGDDG